MTVDLLSVISIHLKSPWSPASWTSKSGLRSTTWQHLSVVAEFLTKKRPPNPNCVCLLRTLFYRLGDHKNLIHQSSPITRGDGLTTCTTTSQLWWLLSIMITNISTIMVLVSTLLETHLKIRAMLSLLRHAWQQGFSLEISIHLCLQLRLETKTNEMTMVWTKSRENSQQFLMWTHKAWRATMIISSLTCRTDPGWRMALRCSLINPSCRWGVVDAMTLAWITSRHQSQCPTRDEESKRAIPII